MQCYRVAEKAILGIHLSESDGGLYIDVGDARAELDSRLAASINSAQLKVLSRLRECATRREYRGRTLDEQQVERVKHMAWVVENEAPALLYADVSRAGALIRDQAQSADALVLVETMAGPQGRLNFMSTTFTEYVDTTSNRIRRRYGGQFPPPGVTIIKEGKSSFGGPCYLLRMVPNSSFRIERTGDLEGAPRTLTVVWRGRRERESNSPYPLLVFSPLHRQES